MIPPVLIKLAIADAGTVHEALRRTIDQLAEIEERAARVKAMGVGSLGRGSGVAGGGGSGGGGGGGGGRGPKIGDEEKKAAAEAKRAAKEIADVQKSAFKAQEASSKNQFQEWRKRQAQHDAGLKRVEARRGSMGATLGTAVAATAVVGGALALRSGLHLAEKALSDFASFLYTDVIKSGLKRDQEAGKIGNRLGGKGAAIAGTARVFEKEYADFDAATIMETIGAAQERTKSLEGTQEIAALALKIGDAFKLDPKSLADALGQARVSMPGMNAKDFETFGVLATRKVMNEGGNLKISDIAAQMSTFGAMASKFGGADGVQAHRRIGLMGVAGAMSKDASFKSSDEAVSTLDNAIGEISKNVVGAVNPSTGMARGLDYTLPVLLRQYGGNARTMELGGLENSAKLVRSLGLDAKYRDAEKAKAGSGMSAVGAAVIDLSKVNRGGAEMETVDRERAANARDASSSLNSAFAEVKAAFDSALLPVIKDQLVPALKGTAPEVAKIVSELAKVAKGMEGVDLVGIFTAIVKGLGQMMYHLLNLANQTGVIKIDQGALDGMKKATGAASTQFAAGNAASGAAGSFLEGANPANWNSPWDAVKGIARLNPITLAAAGGVYVAGKAAAAYSDEGAGGTGGGKVPTTPGAPLAPATLQSADFAKLSGSIDKLASSIDDVPIGAPMSTPATIGVPFTARPMIP